jgi:hypothetical protein
MKSKAPRNAAPLADPIRTAMRDSPAIRTALVRLRPADRAHANRAIADMIAAQLRHKGWPE